MKKVLMIILDFPPCRSAGVQRSLRFAEFLPEFGWQPFIVTATDNIYDRKDEGLEVPPHLDGRVIKAQALDATKEYAIKGKYFNFMALPDRFWPWYFDAVKKASEIIEKENPDVIWSTYPVLTAHLIARKLSQKYNIPLVLDYRDPLQCHYDQQAQSFAWLKKWLERKVISSADKVVMTSKNAVDFYKDVFLKNDAGKFTCVENGFYQAVDSVKSSKSDNNKFTLLYSGAIYINGRDPRPLFNALAKLRSEGVISPENFILKFRATKNFYADYITQLKINDLVIFLPAFSYQEAQDEMTIADANLLIQDDIFNRQVPGKLYEYISVRKPVLALTPKNSATHHVIEQFGYGYQAEGVEDIARQIIHLINNDIDCSGVIESFSRKAKTMALADVFNSVYAK